MGLLQLQCHPAWQSTSSAPREASWLHPSRGSDTWSAPLQDPAAVWIHLPSCYSFKIHVRGYSLNTFQSKGQDDSAIVILVSNHHASGSPLQDELGCSPLQDSGRSVLAGGTGLLFSASWRGKGNGADAKQCLSFPQQTGPGFFKEMAHTNSLSDELGFDAFETLCLNAWD